ncbi:hypothetical protein SAMN02745664_10474 [Moraxella cuniculi DSM 21768]|uniref:Uncharacterized protein n=1 Tax=Moraxella cuniculi DSM 21768 TaxID=1122245 RepID=A0A1N7EDC7_9GAMM|nr:hypothetical protein [Moraxella cuniculi]OOS05332.1 hypothetical protein B0189_06905 [Moraxella cuniculi]SIR86087.1 hypothetical protein SAMN02745664_10474 [Moraxella cuniculi DSM 21768]
MNASDEQNSINQQLDNLEHQPSQPKTATNEPINSVKKCSSMGRILEMLIKFLSLLMAIAVVIGGLNVYSYLTAINQKSLFASTVGLSESFIAILVAYFIFSLMMAVGFLSPFLSHVLLLGIYFDEQKQNTKRAVGNQINKQSVFNFHPRLKQLSLTIKLSLSNKSNKAKFFLVGFLLSITPILLIIIPLLPVLFFAICLPLIVIKILFFGEKRALSLDTLSKFIHWNLFLCTLIFALAVYFDSEWLLNLTVAFFALSSFCYTIHFIKNKYGCRELLLKKILFVLAPPVFLVVSLLLFFELVVFPTNSILEKDRSWIFYIVSVVLYGLSCLFSHLSASDYTENKQYDTPEYNITLLVLGLSFVPSLVYTLYVMFFANYNILLYASRFIERPQDSAWYLVHNSNAMIDTINGFTKSDIEKYKQSFEPISWSKFCKEDAFTGTNIANPRPNAALYGYMAWNLGVTKVFCPQSVDFFDGSENKKAKSAQCLVIEGKYLQPVSEGFLFNDK